MGKPSDRDRGCWYFQRYVPHLPAAQELVLFNRSWYNRAGVERVMGFCTDDEYEEFMGSVADFEHMLVHSGIKLFKYYLDIQQARAETTPQGAPRQPAQTMEDQRDRRSGDQILEAIQSGAQRNVGPHP